MSSTEIRLSWSSSRLVKVACDEGVTGRIAVVLAAGNVKAAGVDHDLNALDTHGQSHVISTWRLLIILDLACARCEDVETC